MSSKRAKDYKAVLDTLLNLLPVEPNVEEFVTDFEQAIWLAVRQSFNGRVKMSGCYFHWSQAVWRKLVDIGLGPAYRKKCSETRKICKRLMFLPFFQIEKSLGIQQTKAISSRESYHALSIYLSHLDLAFNCQMATEDVVGIHESSSY